MTIDKKAVLRQVGGKIAYFRTLVGMTQGELAQKINTTRSTVSKIECGNYNGRLDMIYLINIAEALQIDLSLLLTFSSFEKDMWEKNQSKQTGKNYKKQ